MDSSLENATLLVNLLEDQFKIFGFKFGIDPLLGLVPGWGDFVTFLISLYLIWVGLKLKLPKRKIFRMLANLSLDFVLGLVPLFGDVGDFVFRANRRNLAILKSLNEDQSFQS